MVDPASNPIFNKSSDWQNKYNSDLSKPGANPDRDRDITNQAFQVAYNGGDAKALHNAVNGASGPEHNDLVALEKAAVYEHDYTTHSGNGTADLINAYNAWNTAVHPGQHSNPLTWEDFLNELGGVSLNDVTQAEDRQGFTR